MIWVSVFVGVIAFGVSLFRGRRRHHLDEADIGSAMQRLDALEREIEEALADNARLVSEIRDWRRATGCNSPDDAIATGVIAPVRHASLRRPRRVLNTGA